MLQIKSFFYNLLYKMGNTLKLDSMRMYYCAVLN